VIGTDPVGHLDSSEKLIAPPGRLAAGCDAVAAGVKMVEATVFAGVYGSLRVHPWMRNGTHDQDVDSLFTARASAMGWSSVLGGSGLWG
jgi:hypothetical protein